MGSGSKFLNSKVARRIFLLFVLCAFIPIALLSTLAFRQVSDHLRSAAAERLRLASRAHGQGIAERLSLLETELLLAIRTQPSLDPERASETARMPATSTDEHLIDLTRIDRAGAVTLRDSVDGVPTLSRVESDHLASGATLLAVQPRGEGLPRVHMIRAVDPTDLDDGLWAASLDPLFVLAGGPDTLAGNTELCVFDHSFAPVFCTVPRDRLLPASVLADVAASSTGTFEWESFGGEYVAGHWSLPLAYRFHAPHWTVMLSENRESVVAPVARFRQAFPLVAVALLCVAFLLSVSEIRRVLVPLERLRDGTARIGEQDFETRVDVTSGDEFEELAESFNVMAGRLGKQFHALATLSEVDRAILSTLDLEAVVTTVLKSIPRLIVCDAVNVTLAARGGERPPSSYSLETDSNSGPTVEDIGLDATDARDLQRSAGVLEIEPPGRVPDYLAAMAGFGCERYLVLPLGGSVSGPVGAISMGYAGQIDYDEDDLAQVRRLADQVTVALSNVHLLEELDDLNWGALTALARTVDAKSAWTAGHSERVARMALRIGQTMNLSKRELATLHRGGLLHDIGKISVPAVIIDKPGTLTVEEFVIMKSHPVVGADILAPIGAYTDAIPIVRQHHERWDGGGYPEGFAGTRINRLARVLSVADCYDAVVSDRPYRARRSADEAIRTIAEVSGTQLDPEVVEAFLGMMQAAGHARPAVASSIVEREAAGASREAAGASVK